MTTVMENGIKEGAQEGKTQGAAEKSIEIAKNMLTRGMDISDIFDVIGLSLENIKKLAVE